MFLLNAALLLLAVILLAATPATVSFPVTTTQLSMLAAGLAAVLATNAWLLRSSLRPLQELALLMSRVDLLVPGRRLRPDGARELRLLALAFNEMLDRLEGERRQSSSLTVGRAEDERRELARELHDEVGQRLTAQLLSLRAAIDEAPAHLVPRLVQVQELARGNLNEVRRIARHLRPTMLDDLGLPYALHGLVDIAEADSGIAFVREIDGVLPALAPEDELALYRIAQEALTNVLRHAAASAVTVRLERAGSGARLTVADDGRGTLVAAGAESGGIRGMRERAVAAGGRLEIASRVGEGTVVTFTVTCRG